MASHNIYFINKFSAGADTQDYVLFSEAPKVTRNSANVAVFSNVFQSTTLSGEESWAVGINNSHFAWCGLSDGTLAPSSKVDVSMGKLAALGTIPASGSVFSLSSVQGRPNLKSKITQSGDAGAFAVEVGSLLQNGTNFVVGNGAINDEGQLKPLATVAAPAGAILNIAPAKKFYIAAHSSSTGAIIDAASISRNSAVINFAANPGKHGVVITHESNGSFTVKYATQETFSQAIVIASARRPASKLVAKNDAREAELHALRQQIKDIQLQFELAIRAGGLSQVLPVSQSAAGPVAVPANPVVAPKATPASNATSTTEPFPVIPSSAPVTVNGSDPYPVKPITTWYKATLPFRNAPGQSRRRDVRDRVTSHMQGLGYTYEGGSIDNLLVAMFSHNAGTYGDWHSVDQASQDWNDAAQNLPKHLKGFMVFAEDFKVIRAPEAKGLWRARGETESRVNSPPTSPVLPTLANGGSSRRSVSPAKSSRSTTPTSATVKPLINGLNGSSGRNGNNAPAKPLTNGVNGNHGRNASGAKPVTNGVHTNAVKPVTNGTTPRKYDYPRAQETAIEVAKRRARAVLQAEGLAEFASGWQVSEK